MRLIPIFDTSAIINLSKRDPMEPSLNHLRSSVPQHGWPASFVTVLELFNGLSRAGADQFDESLKPVQLAARLSRRRVLLLSIPFMHKELFNVVIDRQCTVSTNNLSRYLGMLQQPNVRNDFATGRFKFLPTIERLIVTMRQGYKNFMEGFFDEKIPNWRSARERSGSPLPKKWREELKRTLPTSKWKDDVAKYFVPESFKGLTAEESLRLLRDRCDAYLTFTVSVLRDSFMTRYRFEDNSNDFHDGMQLLYLSRPWFCSVTEDAHLIGRVKKSSQSDRVLTIDQFVSRAKSQTS